MILGSITVISALAAAVTCIFYGNFETLGFVWLALGSFAGYYLLLLLVAFLFLLLICAFVDTDKPQGEDSKFYRSVMHLYIEALISLVMIDLNTSGLEKTPKEGRFLLVCNHLELPDPGIILHCFKDSQLSFISKRENTAMPVIGKMMHKISCQLLNRGDDRQGLRVILKCIQLIKEDKVSIAVFPEGHTSPDGCLDSFRNGVFKIAQKANVPIVVCTLRGTQVLFHNLKRLRRTPVELKLLEVIPAEELVGKTAVEVGDRVHAIMTQDLGTGPALVE